MKKKKKKENVIFSYCNIFYFQCCIFSILGKLLSIETVSVPVVNGNMSTKDTKWTEHVKDDLPYAYILRIFQVKSDDNKYTIGKYHE